MSLAWKHMTKKPPAPTEPDSLGCIECNHCGKTFTFRSQTSNLLEHLKRDHRSRIEEDLLAQAATKPKIVQQQPSLHAMLSTARPYGRESKDQQRRLDELVRLIVGCKLPPHLIDHARMESFCKLLDARFTLPCRQSFLATLLPAYASRLLLQLRENLATMRVLSLTLDMWTQHRHPFLVVTGHWVTQACELDSSCFGLLYFPESHTSERIQFRVFELLHAIFPDRDVVSGPKCKIVSLTTDTGANVKKMGMESPWQWLPCFNHVLNLVVHAAIDAPVISNVTDRARALVTAFRNVQQLTVALSTRQRTEDQPQRTLVLDVRTRWNSLYLMLDRLMQEKVNIQVVLLTCEMRDKDLSVSDWKIVEHLVSVLKIFYIGTVYMSAQKHVTSSLVSPMVHRIATTISTPNPPDTPQVVKDLKVALQQSVGKRLIDYLMPSSVYRHACALDPRWKAHPVNNLESLCTQDGIPEEVGGNTALWEAIGNALEYRRQKSSAATGVPAAGAPAPAPAPAEPAPAASVSTATASGNRRKFPKLDETFFGQEYAPPATRSVPNAPAGPPSIKDQITAYRALPVEPGEVDPLAWWKDHAKQFPDLFEYALVLLVMQASETPSERAFSWAGAFYSDSRSRMDPQVLSDYMFIYSNDPILKKDRAAFDEESDDDD